MVSQAQGHAASGVMEPGCQHRSFDHARAPHPGEGGRFWSVVLAHPGPRRSTGTFLLASPSPPKGQIASCL